MSKFHFTLDDNGNVSNISFPKTNIEAKIEYPEPSESGENVVPTGVSINGQSMSVSQFSEIKVEKDNSGNIIIGGDSSSGGDHPWWWDIFDKIKDPITNGRPSGKVEYVGTEKEITTNDYKRSIDS